MKLYNKSGKNGRAIIIDPKLVIKGGRFLDHDHAKERVYFDPETRIEVQDDYGKKILAMYSGIVMQLDEHNAPIEPEKKVKKTVKKAIKKVKKTKKR